MEKTTLISIVTPAFNRGFCLQRCLNSVKNLVLPDGFDFEHIVIDDGSTDNTEDVIEANSHDKLLYAKLTHNQGVNVARNQGMEMAKGDYVLFLDSDDILISHALVEIKKALELTNYHYKIYKFLTANARTGVVMGRVSPPYVNVSYRDRLAGRIISGEVIVMLSKEVYENNKFPEDFLCFEAVFWNLLSKKYESEVGVDQVIRLYHDDHQSPTQK